ncbi:hypothetical protein J542_3749 [Acinetobacter baumannii 299505]|nr:hypothetical protein J542_3749 [Acinetobacter baumannii 299505]
MVDASTALATESSTSISLKFSIPTKTLGLASVLGEAI